jgi:hypothetical protein
VLFSPGFKTYEFNASLGQRQSPNLHYIVSIAPAWGNPDMPQAKVAA